MTKKSEPGVALVPGGGAEQDRVRRGDFKSRL